MRSIKYAGLLSIVLFPIVAVHSGVRVIPPTMIRGFNCRSGGTGEVTYQDGHFRTDYHSAPQIRIGFYPPVQLAMNRPITVPATFGIHARQTWTDRNEMGQILSTYLVGQLLINVSLTRAGFTLQSANPNPVRLGHAAIKKIETSIPVTVYRGEGFLSFGLDRMLTATFDFDPSVNGGISGVLDGSSCTPILVGGAEEPEENPGEPGGGGGIPPRRP